jgi:hypothetical protein
MFLLAGSAADAASCKYKVNHIDLFTKEKLVATEWYSMTSAMSAAFKIVTQNRASVSVAAIGEGDLRFIAVKLKMNDGSGKRPSNEDLYDALFVEEGSPLTITLADQSELVLHARKSVRAASRVSTNTSPWTVESNIVVHYPLDDDAISALLSKDASVVNVTAIGGRYDFVDSNSQISFELNRKGRDRFTEAVSCLNKA